MPEQDTVKLVTVPEPFPVFLVSGHYLLYDINTITYARREHNICGVLIGTLPKIPQQNVFLGVPLHLMPEEARVLVDKGVAFVVDDAKVHSVALPAQLGEAEKLAYQRDLEREGHREALMSEQKTTAKKEMALKRIGRLAEESSTPVKTEAQIGGQNGVSGVDEKETSLFAPPSPTQPRPTCSPPTTLIPHHITPTLAHPPLPPPSPHTASPHLPPVPATSYPLYAHLHSLGYFMTPGLRFGCQYSVYPGDPLRFHSHFLAIGVGWDEPIDLLGLVGGGRLGTGVKKGFLIGGQQQAEPSDEMSIAADHERRLDAGKMRMICIEWASM